MMFRSDKKHNEEPHLPLPLSIVMQDNQRFKLLEQHVAKNVLEKSPAHKDEMKEHTMKGAFRETW